MSGATTRCQAVMRSPRHVEIELTGRCNLRCAYCYRGPDSTRTRTGRTGSDATSTAHWRPDDVPTDAWLRFFEELESLAVLRVTLGGGEPLLRADLPALLQGIVRHRMRFALLTNGTLVDDRAAAMLAATNRCDFVQVSLDSAAPEAHDAFRGEGSFVRAVRGIRSLLRAGVPVEVRLTVHRRNADALEHAARFLLEDLGLPSFSTNAASLLGRCGRGIEEARLTVAERSKAMRVLLALARRYPGRLTATAGPLYDALTWTRMEAARRRGEPPWRQGGRLTGCGCPFHTIAVRHDGAMVVCLLLPGMVVGTIGHDPLGSVWLKSPVLRRMRARTEVPLSSLPACAGCPYVPYCSGNCPAPAVATGGLEEPDPDGCLRRFLEAGGELPEDGSA